MSPRGGARKGAGAKPRAGEPMNEVLRAPCTLVQKQWAEHVARVSGLTVAEWLRSLVDRAVGEHVCDRQCAVIERSKKR